MLTHEADCAAVIPVAWVLTQTGMLNLAHAREFSYDVKKQELAVWWTGDFPADDNTGIRAGVYDTSRLVRYTVSAREMERFADQVVGPGAIG